LRSLRSPELISVCHQDLLFKQFQKSPENPYALSSVLQSASVLLIDLLSSSFNQVTVEYDATTEEKVDALRRRQEEIRDRLREKS
jgi:hypothetical protein